MMYALIIEDDPAINTLVALVLRKKEFEVDTARDGEAGVQMIRQKQYDVLLMDLMMPKVNGYQVATYLRQHRPEMLDRTIVMTAVPEKALEKKELHGVRHIIHKPFDLDMLVKYAHDCCNPPGPRT